MRHYNPYLLLYLIPVALVAGAIYYALTIRDSLNILSSTAIIALVVFTILFMARNVKKSNIIANSNIEEDNPEAFIRKIIKIKNAHMREEDLQAMIEDAKDIYNSPIARAEKTVRLKILVDKYLEENSNKIK